MSDSLEAEVILGSNWWFSLNSYFCLEGTVNVLKFPTHVACQKGLDKLGRPRSDCFWRFKKQSDLGLPCLLFWQAIWGSNWWFSLNSYFYLESTVNVLKFPKDVACQKGLDKQDRLRSDCFWRSSLIWVFPEEAVWSGSSLFAILTSNMRQQLTIFS